MEKIHYLQSRSGISLLRAPHPVFRIDAAVNPYAGCRSGCLYCACGSCEKIGVKTDFIHFLDKSLRESGRRLHLGLGTACEPYGDTEEKFALTRHVIEVAIKHSAPLQIFTKSQLIVRDAGLLRGHSQKGLLAASVSLFTTDTRLARLFEPDLPEPGARLDVVRELTRQGIFAGVVLAPIIPCISDAGEDIEELFSEVRKAGGEYILPSVLTLPNDAVRRQVMATVSHEFSRHRERFEELYAAGPLPDEGYTLRMNDLLREISCKSGIPLHLPLMDGSAGSVDIRQETAG